MNMPQSSPPEPLGRLPILDESLGTLSAVFDEAQQRAAEQRLAAEQLLEQARLLEERIVTEARQAHIAESRTRAATHARALEAARAREREAAENAEASAVNLEILVAQREDAARRVEAARNAVALATALLADEERACEAAGSAEESERRNTDELQALLEERRRVRERAEADLQTVQAQIPPASERPPSMAVIDELSVLEARIGLSAEAARRVAERRMADSARRAAKEQQKG